MAKLAALLRFTGERANNVTRPKLRVEPDPFRLRSLPNEDVFFFCKKVNNARLVREADPHSRSECWSAIGAAVALVALIAGAMAPSAASTMAGYRLQELKQEEQRLLDERRVLDLEEARLLNPARLQELARAGQLSVPAPGQVIRLDPKADGALALNVNR